MIMATTVFAASGSRAGFVTYAKIVDIEEIWRTAKVKRYSDCRDVINDSVTSTLCDTIEWKTINDSVDHYRVTYELHGKTFTMKHKKRPIGTEKRMTISVTPYG